MKGIIIFSVVLFGWIDWGKSQEEDSPTTGGISKESVEKKKRSTEQKVDSSVVTDTSQADPEKAEAKSAKKEISLPSLELFPDVKDISMVSESGPFIALQPSDFFTPGEPSMPPLPPLPVPVQTGGMTKIDGRSVITSVRRTTPQSLRPERELRRINGKWVICLKK